MSVCILIFLTQIFKLQAVSDHSQLSLSSLSLSTVSWGELPFPRMQNLLAFCLSIALLSLISLAFFAYFVRKTEPKKTLSCLLDLVFLCLQSVSVACSGWLQQDNNNTITRRQTLWRAQLLLGSAPGLSSQLSVCRDHVTIM